MDPSKTASDVRGDVLRVVLALVVIVGLCAGTRHPQITGALMFVAVGAVIGFLYGVPRIEVRR